MKEQTTQWEEWKKTIAGTDKKVWIVTAAVLLILLAVAALCLHGFDTTQQEDILCPYQWEQKSSGELVVTIDAAAVKNVEFAEAEAEDSEAKTECAIKRSGSKVRCTFRGTEMGVTQVVLLGQRTEPLAETVCEIRLVLSVQEDLSVEVVEAQETENVTFQKVEAQNAYPCYYIPYTGESSTALEIQVQQTEDNGWMFLTEGNVMTVSAMRYEGTCYLGILPKQAQDQASEARVMIYNATEDIQYTFVLSAAPEGTLTVESATVGNCEFTEEGDSFRTLEAPEESSNP